ncbi:MAG: DUF4416 family protein [Aquificae bacterium]|nr:DUF4416 family protein [Aquificota bacterium]
MDRQKALLLFALMWQPSYENHLKDVEITIKGQFGKIISQTEIFSLPYSKYYEKEMGKNLLKKFVVLDKLIQKEEMANLKKFSIDLENHHRINGNRTVNIDPIYLEEFQVVVATSKYRGSRIYLCDGVYADLELLYYNGSFQPMVWTYLDYKKFVPFFNSVRKIFFEKMKYT